MYVIDVCMYARVVCNVCMLSMRVGYARYVYVYVWYVMYVRIQSGMQVCVYECYVCRLCVRLYVWYVCADVAYLMYVR